ncbi:MAG: fused MFS/spermidine synthase [Nitrospirales bacterium]|nr:fused MFS/spermidine synthase [Nitrospirales bacterium]
MPHVDVPATHSGAAIGISSHISKVPSADFGPLNNNSTSAEPPNRNGLVLPIFVATIFLSSLLVFSVQPMFAKMVLPLLGGSPGVWNTAMLFFQIMLLIGYIYAHLITRLLGIKWQVCLHISIMSIIFSFLPLGVAKGWTPPAGNAPVPWLIGLFAVSVGFPFFAVATNAPLLQRWFSHTKHSSAADPYFLYGASNLGSILALLSYPLFFEPLLTIHKQSLAWGWAYAVLVGLLVICSVTVWQRYSPATATGCSQYTTISVSTESITKPQRLHWLALAFVPSSLLLGVTMHITTDVAAVPLLWVLPLMLYLLTFVIVFARRPWLPHNWMVLAQPFFLIPLGFQRFSGLILNIALPMAAFFVSTMVCHGELVKRRPQTNHLTEFYLWMSLGGMLGGVFNVLIAPLLFNSVIEYSLMVVLACFLRPWHVPTQRWITAPDVLWPTLLLAVLGGPLLMGWHPTDWGIAGILIFCLVLGLGTYSFRHKPARFGLGIGAVLLLTSLLGTQDTVLTRERSFFGVNTVQRTEMGDYHLLVHGRTIHGAQHTDPTRWKEPLTYYHHEGPLGQLFSVFQESGITLHQIAAIGLGAGTSACYRQPDQYWTFHEIDPKVVMLAQDPRYFHYLSECGGNADIVYGDARLSLSTAPNQHYDLLILDAFSSDSIPVHLITREALALYLQKITPSGILIFHISNNNLELSAVMGNLATDANLVGWIQRYRVKNDDQRSQYYMSSDWVVMARPSTDFRILDEDSRWERLTPDPSARVWTDDYSNIVGVLKILQQQ